MRRIGACCFSGAGIGENVGSVQTEVQPGAVWATCCSHNWRNYNVWVQSLRWRWWWSPWTSSVASSFSPSWGGPGRPTAPRPPPPDGGKKLPFFE